MRGMLFFSLHSFSFPYTYRGRAYNPVGRYGFVFSPRWQNEGIEKKERAFRDCARSVEAYSCALYTEDFGGRL